MVLVIVIILLTVVLVTVIILTVDCGVSQWIILTVDYGVSQWIIIREFRLLSSSLKSVVSSTAVYIRVFMTVMLESV